MTNDYASRVAGQLSEIKAVQSKLAVLIGRDGAKVVVRTGETVVTVPFVGTLLPPIGGAVQLEISDGQIRATGAATQLPPSGTVAVAGNGSVATITANGASYVLPYLVSSPPAVGDVMLISWLDTGGIIGAKVTSIPTPDAPPVTTPSGGSFHPAPFTAIDSASFGSGRWFSGDVYASASNVGAWWYGSKIRDTIPDNATIVSARIYLSPRQVSGAAPVLQVHTSETRPGETVSFIGSSTGLSSRTGWVDVPLSFIEHLKANAGGLGMNHGGYSIFRGVGADGLSGALDIAWTTP